MLDIYVLKQDLESTYMVECPVFLHEKNHMLDIFQRAGGNNTRREDRTREPSC